MTIYLFIIGSLATFRLATMFAQEKGPGRIFCILRKAPKSPIAREGLSCPLCVSVYMSALITFICWLAGQCPSALVFPVAMGMSGVSVCLSLTIGKEL